MAARGRANLLGLAATAEDMEGECGPKAYDAKLLTYEKRPYESACKAGTVAAAAKDMRVSPLMTVSNFE